MSIMGIAKYLGMVRFECDQEDIRVTVSDGVVEILHKPSQAAVYYLIEDLENFNA